MTDYWIMENWISCKKYLPPFHDRVLIYIDAEMDIMGNIQVGYLETDGNFYFNEKKEDIDSEEIENITHWMPLPEPPKENK